MENPWQPSLEEMNMAISFVAYCGKSNVGYQMQTNEDYILFNEFDDEMLFSSIADGSGTKDNLFNPSSIVSHQIENNLKRFYKKNKELFLSNTRLFMEEAFLAANDTLIGFKLGNEEKFYGFAAAMTCVLLQKDGTLTFGHAGHTRLYLLRNGKIMQLTKDHTEGQRLVDRGVISADDYYTAMERLSLYNGIGIKPVPEVQTYELKLKQNDVIIMTTDGVHYSYKPEAFFDIMMSSNTVDEAVDTIIEAALELKNYPDNISANVLWYRG